MKQQIELKIGVLPDENGQFPAGASVFETGVIVERLRGNRFKLTVRSMYEGETYQLNRTEAAELAAFLRGETLPKS